MNTLTQKIKFTVLLFTLIVPLNYISAKQVKITILHTNDTHSQVEPTDANSPKNADMGGYARRMGVIEQIRAEEENVLLLDAGDYWQGTPFFNFYNGRIEIDALNRMKYDAATLGNHEFDNGMDTMAVILSNANFPIISSNYIFESSFLSNLIKPFIILEREGVRIGVMALNINPKGLILQNYYKGMKYLDPISTAIEISGFLKKDLKCDLVICLSHLGVEEEVPNQVTDFDIIKNTQFIDVVIGGHSHKIIENKTEKNKDGKDVIIAQMGKSGFYLGRIDLLLEK
ncbi:metallophosphatase [Paludibacteraceae bacterium OttesenSCG-928-F17]|nr:metallophosphatase [Paludibacteraceae bacterium OttesenSCG-928-F17]